MTRSVDRTQVAQLDVERTACRPSSLVGEFLQAQFVDPHLGTLVRASVVAYANHDGLHLAQGRITHDGDTVVLPFPVVLRVEFVETGKSLALQLVAVLLGVGQHLKVQVYHVLAGPHGLAVMCRILVIETLGCQLQRHLVLVVVAAVVAAQTDEDTRLPVRQARGIGQQGIGMHEELQVLVLPHVITYVLVDGLGL